MRKKYLKKGTSSMITVSNSSPLIFLAKLNCFDFLKMLFYKVFIPNQVYIDVVIKDRGRVGEKEVNKAIKETWLEVIEITEKDKVERLKRDWKIHQGEAEAIVLVQNLSASRLLTDDNETVLKARDLKISVIRTPGIFLLAKRKGLISTVKGKIDRLIKEGYWMTNEEYENILKEANEL